MSSELALTSFVEAFLLFCFFHLFYLKKKLNSFLFLVLFFSPRRQAGGEIIKREDITPVLFWTKKKN